jgi:hypothetical protein
MISDFIKAAISSQLSAISYQLRRAAAGSIGSAYNGKR